MRFYKNILALLAVMLLTVTAHTQQLTHPMQVIVTAPASVVGNYPYGYQAAGWGPTSLAGPVTGQLVWAYDITPDSIGCDTIPMDLTGKMAMIRRGACNFTVKVKNAQNSGAIGCIICNNNGGTDVINMGGTDATVVIPAVMLSDANCALLDAAIANGDSVSVTFQKPFISGDVVTFDYERPMSQIESIDTMFVDITNAGSSTATNTVTSFTVIDPLGASVTTSKTTASLAVGATETVDVPTLYMPTSKGLYTIIAKNDMAPTDSIVQYFEIGDTIYTLDEQAQHNQPYAWIGITDAAYATGNFRFDMGNVYRVINNGYASRASFSIDNTVTYFGKTFDIRLYELPATITGQELDYSSFTLMGVGSHIIGAADTASNTVIITKSLVDINTFADSVALAAGTRYMLVVSHAGDGTITTSPRFNASGSDVLIDFGVVVYADQLYMGGFGSDSPKPVVRMHVKPATIVGTTAILQPKAFDLFPNPVTDVLNVTIGLEEMAENMNVNLIDINGRIITTQQFSNAQQQNIQFNTSELPAGFYFVRIQTEDGVRVKEFVKK